MTGRLDAYATTVLEDMEHRGLLHRARPIWSAAESTVEMGGRRLVQLASNNYLGLTTHPAVLRAAADAVQVFGTGAGAVRAIVGTMTVHEVCEAKLAALKGAEAAVLMPSGFTANVGVVTALMGPGDLIVSDELNHASIIDGIRLSGAEKRIYPHKDLRALEVCLRDAHRFAKCLVVTDGVFSMDGDIAPLPDIVRLTRQYGATLMVDDAHATGVLGKAGGGTAEHFGVHGGVDIQIGTLSKALAAVGGFIASSRPVVELIRQRARPFLFSAALPPAVAASVTAAMDIMATEPERQARLWENTRYFKGELVRLGFDIGMSETPITPVILGDSKRAQHMSQLLEDAGVLATPIVYPMVPEPKARIRTIVMATHSREELAHAIDAFERIGRSLGVSS